MEFLPFILLVFSLVCCTNGFVVDRRGAPSSLTKQNLDEAHIINIINSHVDQHGFKYIVHYHGECLGECNPKQCTASIAKKSWLPAPDNVKVDLKCVAEGSEHPACLDQGDRKLKFSNGTSHGRHGESVRVLAQNLNTLFQMYDMTAKQLFDQFIDVFGRSYSEADNSGIYQEKLKIFSRNIEIARALNSEEDEDLHRYGITKFMDYSADEYKRYLAPGFTNLAVEEPRKLGAADFDVNNMPESVDWRKLGAVTGVKNQEQCGSCWAFSTTGNIEGQWFLRHGKLWSLSEQELVDCDTLDDGCNGGLPANAYKSVEKLGGLETEKRYPYEAVDDPCSINKSDFKVYINSSVSFSKDETLLAAAVAKMGPISIGINAHVMQFYTGGISHPTKTYCNPQSLDHGVLIVGYGVESGTPYWIIKNSWGPDWGENGYYRLYRGDGSCGVNLMATSSIVY